MHALFASTPQYHFHLPLPRSGSILVNDLSIGLNFEDSATIHHERKISFNSRINKSWNGVIHDYLRRYIHLFWGRKKLISFKICTKICIGMEHGTYKTSPLFAKMKIGNILVDWLNTITSLTKFENLLNQRRARQNYCTCHFNCKTCLLFIRASLVRCRIYVVVRASS